MKRIKLNFLCRKFDALIERGKIYKTGTYNTQDPTFFSKAKVSGKTHYAQLDDCTWGVTITLYKNGTTKALGEIYYTDGELIPRDSWKVEHYKIVNQLISENEAIERRGKHDYCDYEEDLDPAGGYGLHSHI